MACRDPDGNLISADSVDELSEYSQERVPEEEVFFFLIYTYCASSCVPIDAVFQFLCRLGDYLQFSPPFAFLFLSIFLGLVSTVTLFMDLYLK